MQPRSSVLQKNMSVFRDGWVENVSLLTSSMDAIAPLLDFLVVTGGREMGLKGGRRGKRGGGGGGEVVIRHMGDEEIEGRERRDTRYFSFSLQKPIFTKTARCCWSLSSQGREASLSKWSILWRGGAVALPTSSRQR